MKITKCQILKVITNPFTYNLSLFQILDSQTTSPERCEDPLSSVSKQLLYDTKTSTLSNYLNLSKELPPVNSDLNPDLVLAKPTKDTNTSSQQFKPYQPSTTLKSTHLNRRNSCKTIKASNKENRHPNPSSKKVFG